MLTLFRQAQLGKMRVFLLLLFITFQVLGTLYLPTLTANIINNGVVMEDMDYVRRTGALMLGIALFTGIFSILSTYISAEVATRFAKNTRKRLFAQTQKLSYQDYKQFSTGSLITRATNDIEQLQSTLGMFFDMIIPAPFIMIIGLILAFMRDVSMALIILASALFFVLVFILVAKQVFPLFVKVQKSLDQINTTVGQYLSGIRVVRAFNRTKLETERMDASFANLAKINIKINRYFAIVLPIITLGMSLAAVAIVWFGGIRINSGNMQIGDITAIIEYSMNILMYLLMAVFALIFIPRARVCATRIREVLDYAPEIQSGKTRLGTEANLRLEFQDVSFCYYDAENPVLQQISFACEQGTTTAIIGSTGAGKTTLARLIPRLTDATSGQILLNGVNIKDLPQEEARQRIGFVSQKAFLFGGTIAENLRHGKPDASLQELQQAATVAQADDFIRTLEQGYESTVEQGGRNFSGGQRQRLSIARMLVKQPDIYVFDDAFSALDFKTDAALRQALKHVTQNAIVINIAQRISTIRDADQIIVLDEGKLVGQGTHAELLNNCDVYLEIAKSQLSEEDLRA